MFNQRIRFKCPSFRSAGKTARSVRFKSDIGVLELPAGRGELLVRLTGLAENHVGNPEDQIIAIQLVPMP